MEIRFRLPKLNVAGSIPVALQVVANPGRVVYEDENQIAVVPWADEPRL